MRLALLFAGPGKVWTTQDLFAQLLTTPRYTSNQPGKGKGGKKGSKGQAGEVSRLGQFLPSP